MTTDAFELANQGVKGLQPYVPGKPIEELERELGISNIIKLAGNENPLGPSDSVIKAIEAVTKDLTRYPDGSCYKLKMALAEKLAVSPEQITIGNGSNEVLEIIAHTFADSNSEIIFSEHGFAVYPLLTQSIGAQMVVTRARNWGHDLDEMANAITEKTKIIFIANPNNPTGTWLSKGELKAFLKSVPENVLVVLDEAYFEYVDQENYPNGVKLMKKFPNLIVTRTFSKIYGLAALRIGYSVSSPDIAELMNRVRQPFNSNALAQAAAIAAIDDQTYIETSRDLNSKGLVKLETGFQTLELNYIPSVGNFISVEVGPQADLIFKELLQEGVIVRPVANYNMPEFLRVSVGTEEENNRFLAALETVLNRV